MPSYPRYHGSVLAGGFQHHEHCVIGTFDLLYPSQRPAEFPGASAKKRKPSRPSKSGDLLDLTKKNSDL